MTKWIHTTLDVIDERDELADLGIKTDSEQEYIEVPVSFLLEDLNFYCGSAAFPTCTNIRLKGDETTWCINLKYEELRTIMDDV